MRNIRFPLEKTSFGPLLAVLSLLALFPAGALAQACLGSAPRSGQFSLGGYVDFPDDALGYGVEVQSNLPGRVSMGARLGGIDLDDVDERLVSAGGNLAVELGPPDISLCPLVGVGYDYWSGEFAGVDVDYSRLTFPVGVGVGTRFPTGGQLVLIPSARAGVFHTRHSGNADLGDILFSRTDTSTEPFVDGGATLEFGRVYAQGGVLWVRDDDRGTVFRLGLGLVF